LAGPPRAFRGSSNSEIHFQQQFDTSVIENGQTPHRLEANVDAR
jgi:hypothetical protein